MGRQKALLAQIFHDGDNGIGMDDLKGNSAVCVIIAGRIIVKVFFIFIEIDQMCIRDRCTVQMRNLRR